MSLDKQAESIHSCLFNTFLYSEKEIIALQDLTRNREEASTLFYKSYFELEEKKDKQTHLADFGGRSVLDPERINIPKDELMKNRVIAKFLMYPEVDTSKYRKIRNSKTSNSSSHT